MTSDIGSKLLIILQGKTFPGVWPFVGERGEVVRQVFTKFAHERTQRYPQGNFVVMNAGRLVDLDLDQLVEGVIRFGTAVG